MRASNSSIQARVAASGIRGLTAAVVTGAGVIFRAGPGAGPTAAYAGPGVGEGGAATATFLWQPAPKTEMAATAMAASESRCMELLQVPEYCGAGRGGIPS